MKRRNRATRRRKMRGGGNTEEETATVGMRSNSGTNVSSELNEMKDTTIKMKQDEIEGYRPKMEGLETKKEIYRQYENHENNNLQRLSKKIIEKAISLRTLYEANRTSLRGPKNNIQDIQTIEEVNEYRSKYMKNKERRDRAEAAAEVELQQLEDEFNKAKETQLPPPQSTSSTTDTGEGTNEPGAVEQQVETVEEGQTQGERNVPSNMPPPPPAPKYNSDGVPILDEINDENVSQAIENTLPYFEAEKNRLESGQSSVNQKPKSQEKTDVLDHIKKEKAIVEEKIADLKTKSKVEDIKALIAEEKEARQARLETEQKLLNKISDSSNPFETGNMTNTGEGDLFEAFKEQTEQQEMRRENNLSTGLKEEKKQLEGIKKELASSEQATQGSVSSEQQSDPDPLANPVAADIFEIPSSDGLPFRIAESTASADTQTPQPSGVTVQNVEMVCKNLKNKITALEEQIAKLQESNTATSTEKKKPNTGTSTKLPKGNKGTSKGGRKSRNNKKKKKSKAKKNKTRRRRRSEA